MKINTRNLVSDIHAGVKLDDLCKHYELSMSQFRDVFDQLVNAKLLRPEEFPAGSEPAPIREGFQGCGRVYTSRTMNPGRF